MSAKRRFLAAAAAVLSLGTAALHAEDEPAKGWLAFSMTKDINYTSA